MTRMWGIGAVECCPRALEHWSWYGSVGLSLISNQGLGIGSQCMRYQLPHHNARGVTSPPGSLKITGHRSHLFHAQSLS